MPLSLSEAEIGAVVAEIRPAVLHGWIQRVYQPSDYGIVLEIRAPGRTLDLLISAHPGTTRLHLVRKKPANPIHPPAFCQYLRARLHGARVDNVRLVPHDRIVEVGLHGKEGAYILIAELTGRSANLWLVDTARKILARLRPAATNVQDGLLRPRVAARSVAIRNTPPLCHDD